MVRLRLVHDFDQSDSSEVKVGRDFRANAIISSLWGGSPMFGGRIQLIIVLAIGIEITGVDVGRHHKDSVLGVEFDLDGSSSQLSIIPKPFMLGCGVNVTDDVDVHVVSIRLVRDFDHSDSMEVEVGRRFRANAIISSLGGGSPMFGGWVQLPDADIVSGNRH